MQQFNILPINVSQKVEIKDESTDLMSTSSKGEFSQHIDLHLAKSKGATNDDKGVLVNKSDVNTAKTSSENTNAKADDKTLQSSNTSVTTSDETDSASSPLEVAASGKKNDKTLNTEQTVTLAEPEPLVDESQLLMSFLLKADQTLVTNNFAQDIKNSEMSAEQIAKYETQLLLKSSGLVADLSGITQALNTSSEVVFGELKHAAQSLLVAANSTKTDSEAEQLTIKALIEEESLDVEGSTTARFAKLNGHLEGDKTNSDLSLNEKRSLSKDIAINSFDGESANNVTGDEQDIAATQKASDAQLVKNGLAVDSLHAINEDAHKVEQKSIKRESIQQQIVSEDALTENNNIEVSKVSLMPKSPLNEQAMVNRQNPAELASNINEKVVHLAQSNNGIVHNKEEGLAVTIAASQNANSDISSTARNFSQGSFSQGGAATTTAVNLSSTSAEVASQLSDLSEDETQLGTKSVDHLIEQNKGLNSGKNNEITNKVVSNTNTDFSINSDLSEITGRATQASQDIADQQVTDVFNPRASSDISQSQKTNTQLHQETIAMFRKDFSDAVKDKVMLMISQKLQQFDITLDPPELGNIHVKVNLQGEQATVNFVVQNQQAKDAFEQNMHKLKELLAEQGVDVGDANVEQQSQQSDNKDMNQENAADNNHQTMINTADASDVIEHSLSASMLNSSTSAVDYYA